LRPQWKYVTRPREILWPRARIDRGENRRRAIGRGDSRRNSAASFNRHRKSSAQTRSVVSYLWWQMQFVATLFSQWQANQAATLTCHEIDFVGRNHLRGAHEITFILAVLIVHDNDHAPFANVGGSVRNGSECHLESEILILRFV